MAPYEHQQHTNEDDFHSPWIDSFQSNPTHQSGDYEHGPESHPAREENMEPTWHALTDVYDDARR